METNDTTTNAKIPWDDAVIELTEAGRVASAHYVLPASVELPGKTRADLAIYTPEWFLVFRADVQRVFDSAQAEMPAIIDALEAGKIGGHTYDYRGICCPIGIIARARNIKGDFDNAQPFGMGEDSDSPFELFCQRIEPGDTPLNSAWAEYLRDCILECQDAAAGKERPE